MIYAKINISPDGSQQVTLWQVDEVSMQRVIEALMDTPLCVQTLTAEQVVACRDAIDVFPSLSDGLDYPTIG